MRVALDTNRITDLFRGDVELAEQLGTSEEVWIPLFALGEIKAGFQGGTHQRRNETVLNKLLAKLPFACCCPAEKPRNITRESSFNLNEPVPPSRTMTFGLPRWFLNTTLY